MTVNYEFFDQMQPRTARSTLVKQLQNGERPQPTRGARLCTLKEMSVQLAGFADDRGDAARRRPGGRADPAGNRLAERYGIAVPGFDPETPIGKKAEEARGRPTTRRRRPPTASRPATARAAEGGEG